MSLWEFLGTNALVLHCPTMTVYVEGKSWNTQIPYVIEDPNHKQAVETWIKHFNMRVARTIFVPREDSDEGTDYVAFVYDERGESPIGKQGGKQAVKFHWKSEPLQYTILHEMGHCVGLGHEQYNPGWPFKEMLNGTVHGDVYKSNLKKYCIFAERPCDGDSIMLYTLSAFQITEEKAQQHIYKPKKGSTLTEQQKQDFTDKYAGYLKKSGDLSDTDVALIQHLYGNVKT